MGVIYRPPSGNLDKFNESLSVIMSSFQSTQKVYIMGDFNINLFLQTAATKLFEETFICNGFNPVISVSTLHIVNQNVRSPVSTTSLLKILIQ